MHKNKGLEKDSLFLDGISTQNGEYLATHKYINSDTNIVTCICTLYYIHAYNAYLHTYLKIYIQTYMNMYMVGEDFQYHFPREMRSGSSN